MAPSVRVDNRTTSRLECLQAEIRLETGVSVTKKEVLTELIDRAFESRGAVIDSFREERVPVSERQREAFHRGMGASGDGAAETDIDDELYD